MNSIEIRTIVIAGLNKRRGSHYGDILIVEPLSPVPGEPVKLRVTANDPYGKPRVYTVAITEED